MKHLQGNAGWSTWWDKASSSISNPDPLGLSWIHLAIHMGVVHFTRQKNCHNRRFSAREWYHLCFEIVRTLASKVCEGISMHQLWL